MSNDAPNRRWYQFSLKTLMIVMLVFSVTVGWVGFRMRQARDNRDRFLAQYDEGDTQAVAMIEAICGEDGLIGHNTFSLRRPTWLEMLFDDPGGADDPVRVNAVTHVSFYFNTKVTDADLEHLKGLKNLRSLMLCGTNITDAGLGHLKRMETLEQLDLDNTRVTDVGLEHLRSTESLERLYLRNTNVTAKGVKKLQRALPNCDIYFY